MRDSKNTAHQHMNVNDSCQVRDYTQICAASRQIPRSARLARSQSQRKRILRDLESR